jgi:ACS family glucarate transporter-like MFS transporter
VLEAYLTPDTTRRVLVAALAGVPLFFGAFGCVLGGWLMPALVRLRGSVTTARRTLAFTGFTGASVLLVLSFYIRDPLLAMLAMGMASLCNDLTMPGTWNTCMDIGGKFAGTVSGSMNMMSGIGASIAPLVVGFILDHTNRNWSLTFWISGAVYFLGGLCWLGIDPVTPLDRKKS